MPINVCHYCGYSATNKCHDCKFLTCNSHNYCHNGCKEEPLFVPTGSFPSSPFDTPQNSLSDSE